MQLGQQKDHAAVWNHCLNFIRHSVDGQSFDTWFAPIEPVALSGNELTIQVPHRLFYEYLEEHYIEVLKHGLNKSLGTSGRLQYRIKTRKDSPATQSGPAPRPATPPANPFVIPGMARARIESNLEGSYTFENFIEGDCNSLARNAAKAVADNPTNTAFNPLVIHGPVGLGKTHLLRAVGNRFAQRYPNKTVLYVTTDEFTNQLINSISTNSTNELVAYYRQVDVLLVDDIQQLINKRKTQDVFFNLFNVLRQQNRAIVMTCDRPIIELDLEERLRSRFQWGLTADLSAPALETRMAILGAKAKASKVDLPNNVTEYICSHIQNNIRQLEGVLNNLVLHSGLSSTNRIDIDLARRVMKNFVAEAHRDITPESIRRTVASHYHVDLKQLSGSTRRRPVVLARQVSMFLIKEFSDLSLKDIGALFGNRDHTTVIHSVRTINNQLQQNDELANDLEQLRRRIQAGGGSSDVNHAA